MSAQFWQGFSGATLRGVDLQALTTEFGTPLYVYDAQSMREALDSYLSDPRQPVVHYAVKANSNLSLLAKMQAWGAGFDIVSEGELRRVLKAGGKAENIVFSGVAKQDAEILLALEVGVGCLNVESEGELYQISKLAASLGKTAPIALRVNPNVDAKTHPYISTGMKDNKFGIMLEKAAELYHTAATLPNIRIRGIGCHIGSQILTLEPFVQAFDSLLALTDSLVADGIAIEHIDIGGGLGIQMQADKPAPTPRALVDALYERLGSRPYTLHLQPGRSLVGNSGWLLSRVLGLKTQAEKQFVMIDAAMNDYIRPALYQASVQLRNLTREVQNAPLVDVVGPVCETGDTLIKDIALNTEIGDLLAIAGTGAYGMSMSSQYNSRLRAAEVWIENGQVQQIRKRDSYEQIWENELFIS